jgi:hypothetical protein
MPFWRGYVEVNKDVIEGYVHDDCAKHLSNNTPCEANSSMKGDVFLP